MHTNAGYNKGKAAGIVKGLWAEIAQAAWLRSLIWVDLGVERAEVVEPAHREQSQGEKPDRPRDGFAEIETLRAGESENPMAHSK